MFWYCIKITFLQKIVSEFGQGWSPGTGQPDQPTADLPVEPGKTGVQPEPWY